MKRADEITRASVRQTLSILVSLIPLLAFWFISLGHSFLRLRIGIYTGIALLVVMALMGLTRGTLMWATALFFGFALLFVARLENVWVIRHLGPVPSGILFVAMMLTAILGRPFVEEYAREGVPPEQRDSASFVRSCFVLTNFWAATLLVMVLLSVVQLFYPGPGKLSYLFIQLAILLAAMGYQTVYVIHVKHRRLATESASVSMPAATRTAQAAATGLGTIMAFNPRAPEGHSRPSPRGTVVHTSETSSTQTRTVAKRG